MGKGRKADTQTQLVLAATMHGNAFISQKDFLALCVFKNKRIRRGLVRARCPQCREEENYIHIWRLAANALNQQTWEANNLLPSSLRG